MCFPISYNFLYSLIFLILSYISNYFRIFVAKFNVAADRPRPTARRRRPTAAAADHRRRPPPPTVHRRPPAADRPPPPTAAADQLWPMGPKIYLYVNILYVFNRFCIYFVCIYCLFVVFNCIFVYFLTFPSPPHTPLARTHVT